MSDIFKCLVTEIEEDIVHVDTWHENTQENGLATLSLHNIPNSEQIIVGTIMKITVQNGVDYKIEIEKPIQLPEQTLNKVTSFFKSKMLELLNN